MRQQELRFASRGACIPIVAQEKNIGKTQKKEAAEAASKDENKSFLFLKK